MIIRGTRRKSGGMSCPPRHSALPSPPAPGWSRPAGHRRETRRLDILLLLILLGVSALFSGSETAFFALGAAEVARLESDGSGAGRRVGALLRRSSELLSALLIGNLLVNTAASVVTTSLCLHWFGPRGMVVAVPAATIVLLLAGEITPKMLALRYRAPIARFMQGPLTLWMLLNLPVVRLIRLAVDGLLALLPFERTGTRPMTTEELQQACDLAVEDGTLTETEGRSLARLLRLHDIEVRAVMTPRTAVVPMRRGMSLRQVLATARRAGYNRYPVLPAEGERPEGLFHLKDLLGLDPGVEQPLDGPLRPVLFVPESKDVATLLTEMRSGGAHLAAVVDEHGDFTGIVTMADCLQALLGPVADSAKWDAEVIPLGGEPLGDQRPHQPARAGGDQRPAPAPQPRLRDRRRLPDGDAGPGADARRPGHPARARLSVLEMTEHRVDRIQVTLLEDGRSGGERRESS